MAKAIALELPVSIAAVPTTYAGSERTNVWGITRDGKKLTGRDDRVRPRLVVYDPSSRSRSIARSRSTACSTRWRTASRRCTRGRNSRSAPARPRRASRSLDGACVAIAQEPRATRGPHDGAARRRAGFDRPRRRQHGPAPQARARTGRQLGTRRTRARTPTLLPYTLAFNAPAAPEAHERAARAWSATIRPAYLYDLLARSASPRSLRALGLARTSSSRSPTKRCGALPEPAPARSRRPARSARRRVPRSPAARGHGARPERAQYALNSTRRFWARPSSVSLSAMGLSGP